MAKGLSLNSHTILLDYFFNATDPATAPSTLYISLHTGDPGDDGQLDLELASTGAYARVNHGDWTAAAETGAGTSIMFTENDSVITFPTATADWAGPITHAGIWTHATGKTAAQFVGRAELATSRTVSNGDTASFAQGALDVQITETA